MSTADDATYEVGFGKPPKKTQFKPGHSGNPKGRPKGTLNLATAIRKALRERITVLEKGRSRQVSKLEAAITQMVNRAVKGDGRATQQLLQLAPFIDGEGSVSHLAAGIDADQAVMAGIVKRFSQDGSGGGNESES